MGWDDEPSDYRMQHRPPSGGDDTGSPIHDLTHNLPEDVYTHPHYYSDMKDPSCREAHRVINQVRNKPDAKVHIYRALPAEYAHQGIRPGDWVSTSKQYARQHGMQYSESGHDDWPVIHAVVPARHLHTDGDDFREYGYTGEVTHQGTVSFKGGKNQEVHQHADGVVRKVMRRESATKESGVDRSQGSLADQGYAFIRSQDNEHGFGTVRAERHGSYAGHLHFNEDGQEDGDPHIEPHHQHLADELIRRMRLKLPKKRVAILHGFARRSGEDAETFTRRTASSGPQITVVAHVSGNSIDIMHCPFCGSGAVIARSDGTVECTFCTAVFTVQVQPQFAAFPQTAEGNPYQWPGQPGPEQLAGGGAGAMGGFPGPVAGEQDPEAEGSDGSPFADDADESGAGPDDGSDGPDDDGSKAQVGGKDAPPFGKKSSFRTAAGHDLDQADYLRHLALAHARNRGVVAQAIRAAR